MAGSVLIVENEPDLAEIFAEILDFEGIDTNVALNGDTALGWLNEHTPDLVILDMHMPGISGLDVFDAIQADPRLARVPVIAVTADVLLAKEFGARFNEVFVKPVQIADLLKTCHRFLAD